MSAPAGLPPPRNRSKARVTRLEGEPPLLLKDYGERSWPVRLWGRFCLALEERALRRLAGVEGIPAFHSRPSPHAICMQFIDARPISSLARGELPRDFAERLERLFAAIEERGVVHGDPHFRNILCDAEGRPYLIDFSLSYVRGSIPWIDRWLFRNLQALSRKKIAKLRRVFYGEEVRDEARVGFVFRALRFLKRIRNSLKRRRRIPSGDRQQAA